jgi:hypothetical protein
MQKIIPLALWLRGIVPAMATLLLSGAPAWAQLTVTPGGAPSYNIAIDVPPGPGKLSPKLALSYAGGGVNGPVGLGWSVEGLSSITRCPTTVRTDGARRGVNFNATDKLCIDGERLISLDGSGNPQVGVTLLDAAELAANSYREFRTEKDSFARIRAYGTADSRYASSGPAYFKVWTKSGLIYEYGASPSADANTAALILNSAPTAQPRSYAQVWAVSRISDIFGNFIDFKYVQRNVAWGTSGSYQVGHEWNISELQYGGNKVTFTYADRPGTSPQDAGEAYHLGSKNISLRRLSSITTYVNSGNTAVSGPSASAVAVKTYKLTYDNGPITKRSRLVQVQECAGLPTSAKCMPETVFSYTAGGNEAYQASPNFNLASTVLTNNPGTYPNTLLTYGTYGSMSIDANGDGLTDILRWADDPQQNELYLSNGDGSFRTASAFNLAGVRLFSNDGCYASIVKDMNGDGIPDIVRYAVPNGGYSAIGNGACNTGAQSAVLIGNGDGSFTTYAVSGVTLDVETHGTQRAASFFYLLDYDGDGLVDIVTSQLPPLPSSGAPTGCNANIVCTRVFRNTGTPGAFAEIATASAHMNLYQDRANMPLGGRLVDVNADGLQDLVLTLAGSPGYPDSVTVALSNGDGTFTAANGTACSTNGSSTISIDYNGDGRQDCLTAPDGNLYPRFQTFDLANSAPVNVANANLPKVLSRSYPYLIGDVNEDGRQDVIGFQTDSFVNALWLSNGDGTVSASTSWNLGNVPLTPYWNDNTVIVPGDFLGKGNFEILRAFNVHSTLNASNVLYVKVQSERPDVLLSVRTPSGALYSVTQVPLTNSAIAGDGIGARYVPDRGTSKAAVRPYVDVIAPTYVVASLTADAGVGSAKLTTQYKYFGMKADSLLGTLAGFREVRQQTVGPNGSPLTTATEYSIERPYVGMPTAVSIFNAGLQAASAANRISLRTSVYCDQPFASGADATAIQSLTSCPSANILKRPYLLWSRDVENDLDGSVLPTVTTQNAVNSNGEFTMTSTTTTLAGSADTYSSVVNTQYRADDTACSNIQTCNWILGRRTLRTVHNAVPTAMPSTSAGTNANASASSGSGPVPPSLSALLTTILNLLLDD